MFAPLTSLSLFLWPPPPPPEPRTWYEVMGGDEARGLCAALAAIVLATVTIAVVVDARGVLTEVDDAVMTRSRRKAAAQ